MKKNNGIVSMWKKGIGMGWKGESTRHGLSAKGISTGRKSKTFLSNVYNMGADVDYAKLISSKEFRLDDDYTVIARSEDTRSGFRHIAELYKNGQLVDSAKVTYTNRTWESYEFETAIRKLLDTQGFSEEQKKNFLDSTAGKSRAESDSMFKSVAMVAKMGEIFGTTKKEKNDWKARMIKAGLGDKGLDMPEDWETLSEDEKERRLNLVIEQLSPKKKKVDYMMGASYPTKKSLKENIGKPLSYVETSMFGQEYKDNGTFTVVGPDAYNDRKWYAKVTMKDGKIERVE